MTDAAGAPFDDIRRLIAMMPGPDEAAVAAVRERDRRLTKPEGSLGRLEHFAEWLAAWQGKAMPAIDRPLVCVFAGSHGVAARGVSAFPSDVNRQMLENFAAGGAAINLDFSHHFQDIPRAHSTVKRLDRKSSADVEYERIARVSIAVSEVFAVAEN